MPKRLDYSKIPKEIEEEVEAKPTKIEEKASISFDGKQYLVRFPKKISDIMEISERDKIDFTVNLPEPKSKEDSTLTVELVQNEKKKK